MTKKFCTFLRLKGMLQTGCGCKDIQQIQRDIPLKSFWKPRICSSSLNLQKKNGKLILTHLVTPSAM